MTGAFLGLLRDRSRGRRPRVDARRARRPRRAGRDGGELSGTNAKEVFAAHAADGRDRSRRSSSRRGLHQISDASALGAVVDEVIAANPGAVDDYRAGKPVLGFFVGQVMKATRGQANAALVQEAVRERLDGAGTASAADGPPQHRPLARRGVPRRVGYSRARGPWARYQALKEQNANAERYNAWRGGVRDDSETGASVAMFLYRRQAQRGASS